MLWRHLPAGAAAALSPSASAIKQQLCKIICTSSLFHTTPAALCLDSHGFQSSDSVNCLKRHIFWSESSGDNNHVYMSNCGPSINGLFTILASCFYIFIYIIYLFYRLILYIIYIYISFIYCRLRVCYILHKTHKCFQVIRKQQAN